MKTGGEILLSERKKNEGEPNMKIPQRIAALATLAFLAVSLSAQETPKTISLTLDECLVRALKNNLSIQVAVLGPENSDLSVRQALEKYLPNFSFGLAKRKSSNASYSWLESADMTLTKFNNYSAQVSETIPLGGTVTLGLTSAMTNTNQTGTTINPRYNSQLQFSFSQPLLRNFGVQMTQRDIVVARNNLDVSEIQFVQTVQDTIYRVIETYWNLVYSVENLKVQRKSLDLARDFLAKNERSVEIGTLAPLDVLAAQSEVATREANILSAEAAVKTGEDTIKNLLNFTPEEESGLEDVIALDSPGFEERKIEVADALKVAMDKRPDLRISRIDLKTGDLNLRYARNQLSPL
jgi:outer membrane protein TolC